MKLGQNPTTFTTKRQGGRMVEDGRVKHGGYRKNLWEHMSDKEKEFVRNFEPDRRTAALLAVECIIRFRRSGDVKFLRQFRLYAKDFNLIPTERNIENGNLTINLPEDE